MPTSLIPDQHDFFIGENGCHLCQVEVHHLRIDPGKKQGKGITSERRNARIRIEILVIRVYGSANPHPLPGPTAPKEGLQPKTTFVEKEHHILGAREKASYFFMGFF